MFLDRCPSCGKRFGVRLLGKKLVDEEKETDTETMNMPVMTGTKGVRVSNVMSMPETVTYTTDKFELSYRCSKCGHAWTEKSTKVKKSG